MKLYSHYVLGTSFVFQKRMPIANLDPWEAGWVFPKRKGRPPSRPLDGDDHPQLPLNRRACRTGAATANGLQDTCSVERSASPFPLHNCLGTSHFTDEETEA